MFEKKIPYRNKAFMRFCHERMRGLCCLCDLTADRARQWTELHHFGFGGGMSMKPSDLQVARLCKECHDRYPWKAGALVMREKWEHLACLLRDALYLNEAWIEHLEAKRPVELGKCSMDELNRWIATKPKMTMADRDWLVMWVDSRSAEMYDSLIEIEDD